MNHADSELIRGYVYIPAIMALLIGGALGVAIGERTPAKTLWPWILAAILVFNMLAYVMSRGLIDLFERHGIARLNSVAEDKRGE